MGLKSLFFTEEETPKSESLPKVDAATIPPPPTPPPVATAAQPQPEPDGNGEVDQDMKASIESRLAQVQNGQLIDTFLRKMEDLADIITHEGQRVRAAEKVTDGEPDDLYAAIQQRHAALEEERSTFETQRSTKLSEVDARQSELDEINQQMEELEQKHRDIVSEMIASKSNIDARAATFDATIQEISSELYKVESLIKTHLPLSTNSNSEETK